MAFNEGLFWIGLTVFGAGLYFLIDKTHHNRLRAWLATILGLVAVGYSIYKHHYANTLALPLWFYLLCFTWLLIGLDVYDRFRAKPMRADRDENDRLQEDYRILSEKFSELTTKFNQVVFGADKLRRDSDEFYADVVLEWLQTRIHSTAQVSTADLAKKLEIGEEDVKRGLGYLGENYKFVKPLSTQRDLWSYVAGTVPHVLPRFKRINLPADKQAGAVTELPRIYLADWLDESHLFVPASPLVLENRGKEIAHAIQILPATIFYKEVKFDYVDTLTVGEKKKIFRRIQQTDGSEGNTVFYLLRKELEARNQGQGTQNASITLPLTIIYKDPSGLHNCETAAELTYTPINRETSTKAKEQGWKDWPHEAYKWFEIKHNEFKCN